MPETCVYLEDIDASILQEIRYAGYHNFIGRPIPGYKAARCIMTRDAASALKEVQKAALARNLTLKVYDAYRPQKAVDFFLSWCADDTDDAMRTEFYPHIAKRRIVADGYIAALSSHCRGSAVDVTLVPLPVPAQADYRPGQPLVDGTAPYGVRFGDNTIDMGTGFDVFDPKAHTESPRITATAHTNRQLLKSMMLEHGFVDYHKEWWHFLLADEPVIRAMDFDITD